MSVLYHNTIITNSDANQQKDNVQQYQTKNSGCNEITLNSMCHEESTSCTHQSSFILLSKNDDQNSFGSQNEESTNDSNDSLNSSQDAINCNNQTSSSTSSTSPHCSNSKQCTFYDYSSDSTYEYQEFIPLHSIYEEFTLPFENLLEIDDNFDIKKV